MEERGLVTRKGDPQDGRRVRVYVTEQGRALADTLVPEARSHEQGLLAKLNQSDGICLKSALRALLDTLEEREVEKP